MSFHSQSASDGSSVHPVATGYAFKPLPTGDVLIEFFGDEDKSFNTQIITREALARMPVVVHAFFLASKEGQEAALAFFDGMTAKEGNQ